jgi:hypothetical protein
MLNLLKKHYEKILLICTAKNWEHYRFTAAYVAAAYLTIFSKSFQLALNDRKTASKQSEAEERRELYAEFGEKPPEKTEGDE